MVLNYGCGFLLVFRVHGCFLEAVMQKNVVHWLCFQFGHIQYSPFQCMVQYSDYMQTPNKWHLCAYYVYASVNIRVVACGDKMMIHIPHLLSASDD